MNDDDFERQVLRLTYPDWSDDQIEKEVAKTAAEHTAYENSLRAKLLEADTLKEDPTWYWCGMCETATVSCEHCGNASCNGGGCDKCDERFRIAIALSWASGGALGQEPPAWYKELRDSLSQQWDYENCPTCIQKQVDFLKSMVLNREFATQHVTHFSCLEHKSALVEKTLQELEQGSLPLEWDLGE